VKGVPRLESLEVLSVGFPFCVFKIAAGAAFRARGGSWALLGEALVALGAVDLVFNAANFAGLVGGKNPVQTPQTGVEVTLTSKSQGRGFFLPFLGETQALKGVQHGDAVTFTLPAITKGAVFWYEQ